MSKCACENCGCLVLLKMNDDDPGRLYCSHHAFCGVLFEKDPVKLKHIGRFEDGYPEKTPSWCPKEG